MKSLAFRLGARFVLSADGRGRGRILLVVVGTALGTCCVLAALLLPAVLRSRQDRAAARLPVAGAEEGIGEVTFSLAEWRRGGGIIQGVLLSGGAEATVLPPGVDRLPASGEVLLSPRLHELHERRPIPQFAGHRFAGVIQDKGLTGPDELFAYMGVDAAAMPHEARALSRFGSSWRPEVDLEHGDVRLVQWAFMVLVGIPLAVYFIVCARLSAVSRERRLASLRLIGMSARAVRRVNAVEIGLASGLGAVLGAVLFRPAGPALGDLGVGGLRWFPSDGQLHPAVVGLVVAAVPIVSSALSRAGMTRAVRDPLVTRRQMEIPAPNAWRLTPLLLGTSVLMGLALALQGRTAGLARPAPTIMLLAVLLTGVGLAVGLPVLTAAAARAAANRARGLATLLAMRRLQHESGGTSRVVAGLVVLVFGMGFAQGVLRDGQAAASSLGLFERYRVSAGEVEMAQRAALWTVPGVEAVVARFDSITESPAPGVQLSPQQLPVRILVAACADLQRLIEQDLRECEPGIPYRIPRFTGDAPAPRFPAGHRMLVPTGSGEPLRAVDLPEAVLRVPPSQAHIDADVLLPPDEWPLDLLPAQAQFVLVSGATPDVIEGVIEGVARIAPAAVVVPLEDSLAVRLRLGLVRALLLVALGLGLLIGVAAFIVAALDRAFERRRNLVALAVVGVPTRVLRMAQAWQVIVPMAIGCVLAGAAAMLVEYVTVGVGGYTQGATLQSLMLVSGLVALSSVLSVALTVPSVSSRMDISLLRRE